MPELSYCDTFWGSHGCDLPPGHEGEVHVCGAANSRYGICSEMRKIDEKGNGQVRFNHADGSGWGDWMPGWRWFTNHGEVR